DALEPRIGLLHIAAENLLRHAARGGDDGNQDGGRRKMTLRNAHGSSPPSSGTWRPAGRRLRSVAACSPTLPALGTLRNPSQGACHGLNCAEPRHFWKWGYETVAGRAEGTWRGREEFTRARSGQGVIAVSRAHYQASPVRFDLDAPERAIPLLPRGVVPQHVLEAEVLGHVRNRFLPF